MSWVSSLIHAQVMLRKLHVATFSDLVNSKSMTTNELSSVLKTTCVSFPVDDIIQTIRNLVCSTPSQWNLATKLLKRSFSLLSSEQASACGSYLFHLHPDFSSYSLGEYLQGVKSIEKYRKYRSDGTQLAEAHYVFLRNWDTSIQIYKDVIAKCQDVSQGFYYPENLVVNWILQQPAKRWCEGLHLLERTETTLSSILGPLVRTAGPLGIYIYLILKNRFIDYRSQWISKRMLLLPQWKNRWLLGFKIFQIISSGSSLLADEARLQCLFNKQLTIWDDLNHPFGRIFLYLSSIRWQKTFPDFQKHLFRFPHATRLLSLIQNPLEIANSTALSHVIDTFVRQPDLAPETLVIKLVQVSRIVLEKEYCHRLFLKLMKRRFVLLDGEPISHLNLTLYPDQILQIKFQSLAPLVGSSRTASGTLPARLTESTIKAAGEHSAEASEFIENETELSFLSDPMLIEEISITHDSAFASKLKPDCPPDIEYELGDGSSFEKSFMEGDYATDSIMKPESIYTSWNDDVLQGFCPSVRPFCVLVPYFSNHALPSLFPGKLLSERRLYQFISVDLHHRPSLRVYQCITYGDNSEIGKIVKKMQFRNEFILGCSCAKQGGGSFLSSPLCTDGAPLIALKELHFRHPHTGERVLVERTTKLDRIAQTLNTSKRGPSSKRTDLKSVQV